MIQFSINHTRVASLGNLAPVTVHTGMEPSTSLDAFAGSQSKIAKLVESGQLTKSAKKHIIVLKEKLLAVQETADRAREELQSRNHKRKPEQI